MQLFDSASSGTQDLSVSSVDLIVERIKKAITTGKLNVGERLPTEPEMAAQFGVAVVTLRKALAKLRKEGIVQTTRGRNGGTFIAQSPVPNVQLLKDSLLATSTDTLRDFFDEQCAVSGTAARLAAQRLPLGAQTRLPELMFRARDAKTPRECAISDSRFHFEIAVLSNSNRLLLAEQRLYSELSPFLWETEITEASSAVAYRDHLDITMAIEQGDPDKAEKLAVAHVENNMRLILEGKSRLQLALATAAPAGTTAERVAEAAAAAAAASAAASSEDKAVAARKAAQRMAEALGSHLTELFADLQTLNSGIISYISGNSADNNVNITPTNCREIRLLAADFLDAHPRVDGCGLVLARSTAHKSQGQLEWWVREDEGRFARYAFGVTPESERFYDYEQLPWFITSYEHGTIGAVGPYLDYLGVEANIITFTTPATLHGKRVGIIGLDITVADFEEELMPLLMHTEIDAVITNSHGTVLLSNTPEQLPGTLLQEASGIFDQIKIQPLDSGIQLFYRPRVGKR